MLNRPQWHTVDAILNEWKCDPVEAFSERHFPLDRLIDQNQRFLASLFVSSFETISYLCDYAIAIMHAAAKSLFLEETAARKRETLPIPARQGHARFYRPVDWRHRALHHVSGEGVLSGVTAQVHLARTTSGSELSGASGFCSGPPP